MQLSWKWLLHHLDTKLSPQEVAEKWTKVGYPTVCEEGYPWTKNFYVVEIVHTEKHPNADSLSVCQVRVQTEKDAPLRTIVCGASNVRAGMYSILAHPGTVLPGSTTPLTASSIRGVLSNGMLCSAEELHISELFPSIDGIIDLPPSTAVVGMTLWEHLAGPLLYDVEITPNRGDLFSVRGLARELSAIHDDTHLQPYAVPELSPHDTTKRWKTPSFDVSVETSHCQSLFFTRISCVSNGESPLWLRQRLATGGQKSISAFVDITNYLCLDMGRPLHVFDADTIHGTIRLHLSHGGETFEGLDDVQYTLPEGVLVFSDDEGILSLAGILGGKRSACTMATTSVLLESAEFSPEIIAHGGQRLHIHTGARSRFERGIDGTMVRPGLEIATHFIEQYGKASSPTELFSYEQQEKKASAPLIFPCAAVEKIGGVSLSAKDIQDRMTRLGCTVVASSSHDISLLPPPWRHDITRTEDVVEELLRVKGYEEIPSVPFWGHVQNNIWPLAHRRGYQIRQLLVAEGFIENVTFSFISQKNAELFVEGGDASALGILNPLSPEWSHLRPSLLWNLLDIALYHKNHKISLEPIFEMGPQFHGSAPHEQEYAITAVIPVQGVTDWMTSGQVSFYHVKGIVERIWRSIFGENFREYVQEKEDGYPSWYCPGRTLSYVTQGKTVGYVGQIHPRFTHLSPQDYWVYEIFLERLPARHVTPEEFFVPTLQAVAKDLSFFVPPTLSVGPFIQHLEKAGAPELSSIRLLEIFRKDDTSDISVALRCFFQAHEKTFSDTELHALMDKVVQEAHAYGATLRGQWGHAS